MFSLPPTRELTRTPLVPSGMPPCLLFCTPDHKVQLANYRSSDRGIIKHARHLANWRQSSVFKRLTTDLAKYFPLLRFPPPPAPPSALRLLSLIAVYVSLCLRTQDQHLDQLMLQFCAPSLCQQQAQHLRVLQEYHITLCHHAEACDNPF